MTSAGELLKHLDPMPEDLEQGIAESIERNRKAEASIRLTTAEGKPMAGAKVGVEQISHDVLFGANSFMLGGYQTEELNARWEQAYTEVFNSTVVGLFWADYEPEENVFRYESGSEARYRRPAVDDVLAWCDKRQLVAKGHNLIWSSAQHLPPWVREADEAGIRRAMHDRFERVGQRYNGRLRFVDVVNEPFCLKPDSCLPRHFAVEAFKLAEQYLPDTRLLINETTGGAWSENFREHTPYRLMIENLRLRGIERIEGVGMQFHLFNHLHELPDAGGRYLRPGHLLRILDEMALDRVPIHVSEITIGSSGQFSDAEGEAVQARLVRALYRLWFSHPAVEAIYWWNFADGNAFGDEAKYLGGLLREDLSAKPAYDALKALIRDEWTTKLVLEADGDGVVNFRGFHGRYRVTGDGVEETIHVGGGDGHAQEVGGLWKGGDRG